jgi:hypothetical protein
MAHVEHAIRAALLAAPAVVALVGDRVGPPPLPQKPTLPAITYQLISRVRWTGRALPLGHARPRIQIDSWAVEYTQVKDLAAAVQAALCPPDGLSGTFAGVEITVITPGGERDLYDPATSLRRVSADFFVSHKES